MTFTFEQQGHEVASATASKGIALAATVPAGKVTTVLANGQPLGEVGTNTDEEDLAVDDDGGTLGYYALMGQGCPDPAPLGEQPPTS
ncbi:hypothetical protein AB2L27_16075 [Kineococcus sp. LSe6-4]|uniref:Uncharacterized protein n=1 Tax=Kineococcus halophytocola TaxID=3234027 RepID=A0ABV4H5A6_9ACTN